MSELYKISIALAMSSNHNAVLSALSAGLLGVHTRVNQLHGGFDKLKTAITGALAVGAGVTILDTMVKLVEKTKEYSAELAKLENLGGGMAKDVESGEIAKRAFDISTRVHMKVTDLMKIPGASYSILGQEDSMKVWEPLARFQWNMANQKDFKGDSGEEMNKFLRAGELGGRLTDPTTHKAAIEELEKFLDLSQKVMAATHGMVTPSTLLGMSQQAGFSMRGMDDEGLMNMAITAQAMGGPRAGTALLSLYNQVATGKMTKPAAQGMQDLGLLKEGEWESDHGRVLIGDAAKQRLGKVLGKNPMDFVDEIYKNLEAQGVTDPDEQKRRVAQAMSRQTSERFVIEQMMNREQIAAERERMKGGAGADKAFGTFDNKSVESNLKGLSNAWENLLFAVAGPQSEASISVMKQLTSALDGMTGSVRGMDPKTLTMVAEGVGLLGIALVGIGGAALITLAGIPGIIVGLGLALAGFAALNWSTIKSDFEGYGRAIQSFGVAASGLANVAWGAITTGLESIKSAISSFVDALVGIAGKVKGIFSNPTPPGATDKMPSLGSPMRFDGGGPDGKKLIPANFDPGNSQSKTTQTSFSLNVDGRAIAQSVVDQIESLYGFPTGAPSPDGVSRYASGDHNYADV